MGGFSEGLGFRVQGLEPIIVATIVIVVTMVVCRRVKLTVVIIVVITQDTVAPVLWPLWGSYDSGLGCRA